ncbi:MAG: hypothetical protein JNJ57_11435 [Saprospiraceae bacterium]|nr:hypothetical protein [Saprospiraceae bacterium]
MALLITISTNAFSQTTATWQGGKPGRVNDWNCAANWKEGRVPNEFSQVIIPSGAPFSPVIKTEVDPIDALLMEGTTTLTIQNGVTLSILDETGRFGGTIILGKIKNDGIVNIGQGAQVSVKRIAQSKGKCEAVYQRVHSH